MDRERGGDNERTNLLDENKNVKSNKLFTFTKYKNENAGDTSSSEQNIEDPQQYRQKKPNVVRKLEDDFKVYRSHSSQHQSKVSTPSKKGSWWKWGHSDDRKGISTDSASRISCACKRLMCSDYVVMFILTVFFTFSTLLGLVIIFKAFPSLVIVPADDHVRLNRQVDRLSQLHTDGLIDGSLARNSRVGLKSNDYRSWNNPIPTDSVNMRAFHDFNTNRVRDLNQFAETHNDNNAFYKKLLRTAARFRKVKQNPDNSYSNDFVFGDMNRYKRSIGYPLRKHKRRHSPNVHYHNKITNPRKLENKRGISKRQSGEPMGVVIEKNKMVLQFLGPQDSTLDRYHKPLYKSEKYKHQHNFNDHHKNDHLTNHFMEKKFTDKVSNGGFSDILRKGKDKFNHFLNHKNSYDFNSFDNLDNSQIDYLKHQEIKDVKVNQNKEDNCQDIEKDKIASDKTAISNEDPIIIEFNKKKGNPTTTSTTENIERSTETTLENHKPTGAAMEKIPILRKLLQFDENYHEVEDYDHIKTKNKMLMHPDVINDVIVIETSSIDDKMDIGHTNDNDLDINLDVINHNTDSFADIEATIIAEDKQAQANLNDNYGAVMIDVDDGSFDMLQAYSDYGVLQPPINIGYKDKTKIISLDEIDSKINITKAGNSTKLPSVNGVTKEVEDASSAKGTITNGIIRRKLLSFNMDHSDNINKSIIKNNDINTNTGKAANITKNDKTNEVFPKINENTTQKIATNSNITAANGTKIVSKRNVPIFDKDLIFWDDIYDDTKSAHKNPIKSVKGNLALPSFKQKPDSNSDFGEWISNKISNVAENIRNGMQREPIKTNLKVHEVTRTVRNAKIPDITNNFKGHSDKGNKRNIKRQIRNGREINSFVELEENMKRICKEAVKAVEDIKNIKVNSKEKHGTDSYLNNLLMGQLVSLMSELVDYQVDQKTCLKLPPDLREFLIWLTSANDGNNKQDPLKSALDELQMDNDLITSHKSSEPKPGQYPTSSSTSEREDGHVDARSECLGTLEDVQELMQEYQNLPESEKAKMAGVKEYLEKQLDYLYKRLEATQDLNALPVLYTDPLLRKRRNHLHKRGNHHKRVRRSANKNTKINTKGNRHKLSSKHRNPYKNKKLQILI